MLYYTTKVKLKISYNNFITRTYFCSVKITGRIKKADKYKQSLNSYLWFNLYRYLHHMI